jgi:hypothetical protein
LRAPFFIIDIVLPFLSGYSGGGGGGYGDRQFFLPLASASPLTPSLQATAECDKEIESLKLTLCLRLLCSVCVLCSVFSKVKATSE